MSSTASTGNTTKGKRRRKGKADPVTQFALDVVAGKILTNRLARLACERHLRDLENGPKRGLYWDAGLAQRAIDFYPACLRHYKGKWARNAEPFHLSPFQAFQVGSLFGWVWKKTGLRRFRTAYLEEPRKNGKTAKAAGIGLIMLVFDGEPGAEVYSVATKRDQARLVWNDAKQFTLSSSALRRRIQAYRNVLISAANAGRFEALAADDRTLDGLNPSCVILDEVHRILRAIVEVMRTALGAREQPLTIEITTAGDDVESVCWEHHEYSVHILEQLFEDDTWFCYIAGADPEDDWTVETTWYKANPNLGVSKDIEYMRAEFQSAKNKPAEQREFKRLHLGIWSEGVGGWMSMPHWKACIEPFDEAMLKGRRCVAGADLSAKVDLTAYTEFYLPTKEDPFWRLLEWFWVPQAKVDAARRGEFGDLVRYDRWLDDGHIFTTPGDVVDYDSVLNFIVGRKAFEEIGVDPWGATQFTTDLQNEGLLPVEVRQGAKTMSEPTKLLLELVLMGKLKHRGHPVMRWMMANVAVKLDDNNNPMPSKRMSRHRIDGPVSAIIALSRGIAALGTKPKPSPQIHIF